MTLETYRPGGPLADYVAMIWSWDGYNPPHARERILPSGMMEITFNLNDVPFRVYYDKNSTTPHVVDGAMTVGAHSKPFIVETAQPLSLLSVVLKHGGALRLFGVAGHEMQNNYLPLDMLWGAQGRNLYDQLRAAPTTYERMRLLERALLSRLRRASEPHPAVQYALKRFSDVPQGHTIKDVVDSLALSSTRFIQVFREDVGLTPKQFCRVRRFHYAVRLMATNPSMRWVDVALTCGYYDQSHFNKDFRHFSGITPSTFAPFSPDHPMNLPVHDGT